VLSAILAPVITVYDPSKQDLSSRFLYPSLQHLMGTDNFGRDTFTRLLYGARVSLLVAVMSTAISFVCALIIGSIAGYYGGIVDNVIMRIMDVFMAIPGLLLAMCLSAALGSGLVNTAIAMGVGIIPALVRQLRSSILLLKDQDYIEAAKSFGGSDAHNVIHHIFPNAMAPLIVQASLGLGGAITGIAGLSFLGLGVQPPTPEWGNMLATGQAYIRTYWPMIVFPGIIIALTMLAFNLFGDGLRDAMDPHMKR
jgi:peptide/nickel transport system permease protein